MIYPSVKILIAEDDSLNRMLLSKLLQKYGAQCDTAVNGAEALEKLQEEHFDAVFLDINMPVMSGPECAENIIRMFPKKPLIVCISADTNHTHAEIFDYFLIKPFETSEIRDLTDAMTHCLKTEIRYDFNKVIEAIGLDEETMRMLLNEFFSVMSEELANLKKAVSDRNNDMITHVAHKMKGAAAGMMVDDLKEFCSKMQNTDKSDIMGVKLLLIQIDCYYSRFQGTFTN